MSALKEFEGDPTFRSLYRTYAGRRPRSERIHRRLQRVMPGGDTRSVTFFPPFPLAVDRGEGCRVVDADGFAYVDFVNNYNSLIHGHAHPAVTRAVQRQVERGTAYGFPTQSQYELAEEICRRLPCAESVRFCSSGMEATLSAVRLARFVRRKYRIAKLEGGYHGMYDLGLVSMKPSAAEAGPPGRPNPVPQDDSVPPGVLGDCLVLPFNDTAAAAVLIEKAHDDLAAVMVEPMLGAGGMIRPEAGFLDALRDLTRRFGILLIFDEVLTFRVAEGGYQERCGVTPDLTALGKIIGGGFPVGAVAGRADYMDCFSPKRAPFMTHSGTFNGNPVTMVAGLETLKLLTRAEIDRINGYGKLIRGSIREAAAEAGIVCRVTGAGSLAQIHFTAETVRDWRSASSARHDLRALLHMALLEKGFLTAPRGFLNISTPMSESDIRALAAAVAESFEEMKPYVERRAPELAA